jgi:hypothetical protein
MRSRAGQTSPDSSMMAASNSTTIRSSVPSGPSRWGARTTRSQARTGGVPWPTICSLTATAKLNNVEPFAWLRDVLQRMTDGHPASRLDELLPWNWQPINAKA